MLLVWCASIFASGILLYEIIQPSWMIFGVIGLLLYGIVQIGPRCHAMIIVGLCLVFGGCLAMKFRIYCLTREVALPFKSINVVAKVVGYKGNKMILSDLQSTDSLIGYNLPKRILVSFKQYKCRGESEDRGRDECVSRDKLLIGEIIVAKVYCHSPYARFQGFDQRFGAFFESIDAHGVVYKYDVVQSVKSRDMLSKLLDEEAGLPRVILLNDRSDLDESTVQNLARSGFSHILAISGLHLAILHVIVKYIVTWLLYVVHFRSARYFLPIAPFYIIRFVSLIVILFYSYIAGFGYSILRSAIMFCLYMPFKLMDSLAITAMIIMMCFPESIYYAGFQLSFICVLGFCWVKQYKSKFMQAVYVTFAISSLTFVIVAHHFQELALQPFVTNLILMPYVSCVFLPSVFLFSYVPVICNVVYWQCVFFKWILAKLAVVSVICTGLYVPASALGVYCLTIPFFNSNYKVVTYIGWIIVIGLTYCYQQPIAFRDHFGRIYTVEQNIRIRINPDLVKNKSIAKNCKIYDVLTKNQTALYANGEIRSYVSQEWWKV